MADCLYVSSSGEAEPLDGWSFCTKYFMAARKGADREVVELWFIFTGNNPHDLMASTKPIFYCPRLSAAYSDVDTTNELICC